MPHSLAQRLPPALQGLLGALPRLDMPELDAAGQVMGMPTAQPVGVDIGPSDWLLPGILPAPGSEPTSLPRPFRPPYMDIAAPIPRQAMDPRAAGAMQGLGESMLGRPPSSQLETDILGLGAVGLPQRQQMPAYPRPRQREL